MSQVDPVQKGFASVLIWIVRIGLIIMTVSFVLYVSGSVRSSVAPDEVPDYWHLDSCEYRDAAGGHQGWQWMRDLGNGTTLAFAGLIFFPASIIVAVAIAAFLYLRHGVRRYAIISALLAIVLTVAATGVISAGQ